MTTDPNDGITDKQQYDAAVRDLAQFPHGIDSVTAWMSGSMWARAHLAAQEPTEGEVLAVARSFYRTQCGHDLLDGSAYKERWMDTARKALSAASAARRDEEKR